ncbi:Unknown protein [Striga hermonthica]|uniref:RNase H type-1 domain-containing protein n=1 Tax=Striga hermonthica TaxID=68872 RepID=A0A9N7R666_STRHE|nr:Unknown protein [Striga hermonthica]
MPRIFIFTHQCQTNGVGLSVVKGNIQWRLAMSGCLIRRSLPTKVLRHRRHLETTGACTICGDGTETWVHMFFECPWTTQVWARLVRCGFPYWLAHTIPRDSHGLDFIVNAPVGMRFALWFIWLERNNKVFGNPYNSPFAVVKEILSFFQWWKDARLRADRLMDGVSHDIMPKTVTWNPFYCMGMILHTDGSSMGNPGPSGFGVVLHTHEGVWIEGISGNIGIADNTLAEVIAILEGLTLAVARGCTTLTCYSDSQEALRLINTATVPNHVMGGLIMNIRDKISSIANLRFFHIWREGNSVADRLARRGSKEEAFFTTWAFPPDDLLTLLAKDAAMFPYPRL